MELAACVGLHRDRLRQRRTAHLDGHLRQRSIPPNHLATKLPRDILRVCRRSEECTAQQGNQHGAQGVDPHDPLPAVSIVASALRACSTSGRKLGTGWSYLRRN